MVLWKADSVQVSLQCRLKLHCLRSKLIIHFLNSIMFTKANQISLDALHKQYKTTVGLIKQ